MAKIANNIELEAFRLSEEGLEIRYTCDGNEQTIIADPEHAADLLKDYDLINDYNGHGDLITVEWPNMVDDQYQILQAPWGEFVSRFFLSEFEAAGIVNYIEAKKSAQKEADQGFDIFPAMAKILYPTQYAKIHSL